MQATAPAQCRHMFDRMKMALAPSVIRGSRVIKIDTASIGAVRARGFGPVQPTGSMPQSCAGYGRNLRGGPCDDADV